LLSVSSQSNLNINIPRGSCRVEVLKLNVNILGHESLLDSL